MQIKVGTRKSKLAMIQTNLVCDLIKKHFPDITIEIIPIVTSGDKILNKNLYNIGGKALFLKELEEQLIASNIDLAVHSLKDVPGIIPEELSIAAVLPREDARDVLISTKFTNLQEIDDNSIIGSSSVRRKVILEQLNPNIKFTQFRGNVETRLNKLRQGEVDATILALAGLKRLNLFDPKICHPIELNDMLPAAGQGIIGIEIRKSDQSMQELCKQINDQETWYLAAAERGFLTELDASCRTPMAAYAKYDNQGKIIADYMLASEDGKSVKYHR